MIKIYFYCCLFLIGLFLLLSILAVWGAVTGDAVWQSLTTVGLLFGGLFAAGATQNYFFPTKKE